ncbi:hypothetical protein [Anaeromyxobacter sp. Fw109-5]|uniref:hypothetical protein n=1 Tax=Anaeromyxobacter sp. (strain Fw109-5) TaxID=404589 RepID=UPI000158A799|nr:hypothetical protein [Anaeromyxobacter sp. Fw109-5]ABS26065.1 hypothetical protein Anae109_1862 [Anaeromyxobacter sp. Fw109-5]
MPRPILAAFFVLGLAAPARAQLRADPMRLSLVQRAELLAAPIAGDAPAADVLLLSSTGAGAELRPHRRLAAAASPGRFIDASARDVAAAFLGDPAAARADLVFARADGVSVSWAASPGALCVVGGLFPGGAPTVTAARLRPGGDVIVAPVGTGGSTAGAVQAVDLRGCQSADAARWTIEPVFSRVGLADQVYPLRLGATARALGLDDLALPGLGEVQLLVHASPPDAGAGLGGVHLTAVKVGEHVLEAHPAWLPAGVRQGDVHGVAAVDVDLDGVPDLVFSLAVSTVLPDVNGALVSIRNGGDPLALDLTPWSNLTRHLDLQPLVDPVTLRGVSVGGSPGAAVWDRDLGEVVVFWPEGARLATWRGDALGLSIRELVAADVVGSTAPDLVALAEDPTTGASVLLVYPDLDDGSPTIAWTAGSPGEAERGADHAMAVEARDPEGPVTVEWFVGAAATPAGLGPAVTIPGALLCGPGGDVPVVARATDAEGVFREVAGAVKVRLAPPRLALVGGAPPGTLALPPGGTSAVLEGEAWTGCGTQVAFQWSASGVPAGALAAPEESAGHSRRALALPEASYPELLAGRPSVTLVASDASGLTSPPATLALALDATALVDVAHESDEVALGAGEVALLRTRLRSRLGTALPRVRIQHRLDGVTPAGTARVHGATVLEVRADGAELVLETLPPAGSEVTIELPVRGTGGPGASAVQVRSEGDHLLGPAAEARGGGAPLPGHGCASGGPGAGAWLPLVVVALAAARRAARRRASALT